MTTLVDRLRLYFVADPDHSSGEFLTTISEALAGGVTCVQLRAKSWNDREVLEAGENIRRLTDEADALFIVNDRIDIALACGADGVHLGVDDLPIEAARTIGGPSFVIGYSPETDDEASIASKRGADYLGVGPVFGTLTKADAGEAIGLDVVRRRLSISGLPVIGIGGVNSSNARQVVETGASGVAIVSAISQDNDPRRAATELRAALDV